MVVRTTLPRITPCSPKRRINRSTVQLATTTPSRALQRPRGPQKSATGAGYRKILLKSWTALGWLLSLSLNKVDVRLLRKPTFFA